MEARKPKHRKFSTKRPKKAKGFQKVSRANGKGRGKYFTIAQRNAKALGSDAPRARGVARGARSSRRGAVRDQANDARLLATTASPTLNKTVSELRVGV